MKPMRGSHQHQRAKLQQTKRWCHLELQACLTLKAGGASESKNNAVLPAKNLVRNAAPSPLPLGLWTDKVPHKQKELLC